MKIIFKHAMLDCRDVIIGTLAALGILDTLGTLHVGPF